MTRLDREVGQALPMFALVVGALFFMAAVVIDGGNLFQNKQSLQNAADSAAIGAALYIADNTKSCSAGAADPIGACAGLYAGLNGAKNTDGTVTTQLNPCPGTVTDTKPPASPPGCYVYPYNGTANIEVWLTRKTSNYFAGVLGIKTSHESARAVGALTSGNPPPISFAALDSSCDAHTLLIKLGGNLTVNQSIYVNSCNSPQDAFDVFDGGSIKAPSILVHGGWETHNNSTVWTTATGQTWPQVTQCLPAVTNPNSSLYYNGGTFQNPPPTACPIDGVPTLTDPFANFPPAPVPGEPAWNGNITQIQRTAKIATVVTSSAHGLQVGNTVTIGHVGSGFDGTYTVTAVTNPTTFTYDNSLNSAGCMPGCPNLPVITQKQMSGGIATLTTNAPATTLTVGENDLSVAGIDNIFNAAAGTVTVTNNTPGTNSSTFSYQVPVAKRTFNVTKKGLQQGKATLTLNSVTGLATNDTVNVQTGDTLLDGNFILTAVAGATISYTDPAKATLNVTKKAIATAGGKLVATLTTSTNHVFTNDNVTVNIGDSRFDGSQISTGPNPPAGGSTTLQYTIPAVTVNVTKKAVSSGVATLTTSVTPPFEAGDTVTVNTGDTRFDGAVAVTAVNGGAKTFSYTPASIATNKYAVNNNVATLTETAPHALQIGNVVTVAVSSAPAYLAGTWTITAVTNNTFSFSLTHANVATANGNATATIQTVASSAASGTATLTTMPAVASGGTVTVPAFIAANTAASGSAVLTGVPTTAAAGTFTPAWMATPLGVFAQAFNGSPGVPFPREISTGNVTLLPGSYYGGICIGAASGSNCLNSGATANCKAVGGTTTTTPAYSPEVDLAADVPDNSDATGGNTTIQVTHSGISQGDLIAIDDEEMTVTGVNGLTISVTREANGTEDGPHTAGTQVFRVVTTPNGTAYNPKETVFGVTSTSPSSISASATSFVVQAASAPTAANAIKAGEVIQIGSEAMLVNTVSNYDKNNRATVTITTRGYENTTAATHNSGDQIYRAAAAGAPTPASVTLKKGVYIMAGGGFSICGAASVTAPDGVLIYNTNDPFAPTGNGVLGQVDINTSGSVHLGPMTDGTYAGMTIFQDRSQTLVPGTACKDKSTNPNQWDIALQSAAPLPSSGELGSITGTIYAPHLRSDFGDSMSGTTNLAVITSCIYINGANSTFNFNPSNGQLFGITATLGG